MDTSVFLVETPVPVLADGRTPTTWALEAPGPLVTAVIRQVHTGIIVDANTHSGHLAILAKTLAPSQTAVACAAPEYAPTIHANASINNADVVIDELAAPPSPIEGHVALVIIRGMSDLPLAQTYGTARSILVLGPSSEEVTPPQGMAVLGLDREGRPCQDEPAAVLLVRPEDLVEVQHALSEAIVARVDRSATDCVPTTWANRSVESALRLAHVVRQQEEQRSDSLRYEVERALDQMGAARKECESLRNSRSWRLTRFLRELRRW